MILLQLHIYKTYAYVHRAFRSDPKNLIRIGSDRGILHFGLRSDRIGSDRIELFFEGPRTGLGRIELFFWALGSDWVGSGRIEHFYNYYGSDRIGSN